MGCAWSILTDSLGHLVSLKQLSLPGVLQVTSSSHGDPLARLTALTKLEYPAALAATGAPLLALPNLVELRAGVAQPMLMQNLASKPLLRSLTCALNGDNAVEADSAQACAGAVQALTQLTHLQLQGPLALEEWLAMDVGGFAAALSNLKGLYSLGVQVELLAWVHRDLPPGLTRLEVLVPPTDDGAKLLTSTLKQMKSAHGCLRQLVLVGVPPPRRKAVRTAVDAAVRQASLVFGRGSWSVLASGDMSAGVFPR
jgi:hypothetical protein